MPYVHRPVGDPFDGVATLLTLLRTGRAGTRPELVRESALGRNVVSAHLRFAQDLGLVTQAGVAPSNGGRAPELWRFAGERGRVLAASAGAASMRIGLIDLDGTILDHRKIEWAIAEGPDATLSRIATEFDTLLAAHGEQHLWGIGVGLPGPIDHDTGRPIDPPIMPGWDGYDVRGWFADRYPVATWVDKDVNAMALGQLALDPSIRDLIYVKVGTGLGAALVAGGELQRGSQGAAGDIGHVRVDEHGDVPCRCGRSGCLEALSSGWALERDAITAHVQGRSAYLSEVMREHGRITPADIGRGTKRAEPVCMELITRSATRVASALAFLVAFTNPSHVVLGGGVVDSGDLFKDTVERVLRERTLNLVTEELTVALGRVDQVEGLVGCARMVVDGLLAPAFLAAWAPSRTPYGVEAVVHRNVQGRPGR